MSAFCHAANAPYGEVHDLQDSQLTEAVRNGDVTVYGVLYERHVSAAYTLARQLAHSTLEVDDLVAEAFSKVLGVLRAGQGPDSAFRAYLLTVLRHTAYDKTRNDRSVELVEDIETAVNPALVSVPFADTVMAGEDHTLAAKAFSQLPERWRKVLWQTEIKGRSPAEVARSLGLTANGVSALAYRARERLRQAYLQAHLAKPRIKCCEPTVDVLGAWIRGGLPRRESRRVEEHLAACESCRALSVELAEINAAFRIGTAAKPSRGRRAKNRYPGAGPLSLMRETGHSSISLKVAS